MWEVLPSVREILSGVYQTDPSVSAWYGGSVVAPDLEVVDLQESAQWEGQLVRTDMTVQLADPEGLLVPYSASDPLAPYGQQLSAGVDIILGQETDTIPLGQFIITRSEPSSSWRRWKDRYVPTGGVVSLQCQDVLQDLLESEILGLMQPKSTAPSDEIKRLCAGICPVDVSGLPGDVPLVKRSVIYEPVRMNAILTVLAGSSAVARASRGGQLEFFPLPTVVSKQVTVETLEWVEALMTMDRDGCVNTVVTTNDQADSRVQGVSQETSGPFSSSGELKPRVLRKSSALYSSNARAKAAAAEILSQVQKQRSISVSAKAPYDPTIDPGDLHRLTLVPGQLSPEARVRSLKRSPFQATMDIMYSVPREAVEKWARSHG